MNSRQWSQCLLSALVAGALLPLPAAPAAQAQVGGGHGFSRSFTGSIANPGVGRGHIGRFRHGGIGARKLPRRSSRSILGTRFDDSRSRHGRSESRKFDDEQKRRDFEKHIDESGIKSGRFGAHDFDGDRKGFGFDPPFHHTFRHGLFPFFGYRYGGGYYDDDEFRDEPGAEYRDDPGAAESRADTSAETQPPPILPVTPKWIRVDVQVPADGAAPSGETYARRDLAADCSDPTIEITVDGKPVEAFREDCRRTN